MLILKDMTDGKCLMVSSHAPTLKHEAKHGYVTEQWQFVCFVKELKESLLGYISLFTFFKISIYCI